MSPEESVGAISPAPSRSARLACLRERLAEEDLDGFITVHAPNIFYLSGFSGSDGLLAVLSDRVLLLTDFRYEEQARAEVADEAEVHVAVSGLFDLLGQTLGRGASGLEIAFEAEHLTVRDRERLEEKAAGPTWRSSSDLVEAQRATKDAAEVEWIEHAADIACEALERTVPVVEPGMSELDVTAELEYRLRRAGSEGPAFEPIVAAGPRAALPHASPSSRPLEAGDFLLMDFGATSGGYRSDLTRTFVLGEAAPWQRDVHAAVLAARKAALEAALPGVAARDVDGAARGSLQGAGFGERFGHATGHGLGLEVHEAPSVSGRSEAILQEGHVVTIEPGVYLPGRGGVRVEDDVLVRVGGARLLTTFPLDLRVLC